eukprot:9487441-Pyramimonas_sp.AAC.1
MVARAGGGLVPVDGRGGIAGGGGGWGVGAPACGRRWAIVLACVRDHEGGGRYARPPIWSNLGHRAVYASRSVELAAHVGLGSLIAVARQAATTKGPTAAACFGQVAY